METGFNPNIPDKSDGCYFCKVCLIYANSDQMWEIHVAGKRHIKNVMKYPNGLPQRQNDCDDPNSFEKPADYGRYVEDDWDDYPPKDYENGYYAQSSYVPQIRPKVIEYGHKKCSDEILPSFSETRDDVGVSEKDIGPINKIFADRKFDESKQSPKELFNKQDGNMDQSKWENNKVKPYKKESIYDDFEKELDRLLSNSPGIDIFSNDKFKRDVDDLFRGNSSNKDSEDINLISKIHDYTKDILIKSNKAKIVEDFTGVKKPNIAEDFTSVKKPKITENFTSVKKPKIAEDFCLVKRPKNAEDFSLVKRPKIAEDFTLVKRPKNAEDFTLVKRPKNAEDFTLVKRPKNAEDFTSLKKRDDVDTVKDSFKRKSKRRDEEDFIDIFHKINDQKLFQMSAVDEPENANAFKKSPKPKNSKLEDIDPDELTPDLLDNLLSSYLKPKADHLKGKDSAKVCIMKSVGTNTEEDSSDIFVEKLESLPTKTFFGTILTQLKRTDLRDSTELKLLLDVISQAQEVVCKKLPPHLQAVLNSKMMSQNNSKPAPVLTQSTTLPQAKSTVSTLPQAKSTIFTAPNISPVVSQPVSSSASQSSLPVTSKPSSKSRFQSFYLEKAKPKLISPQSVESTVSCPKPQTMPSTSSNSDSLQNMLAWQNYFTLIGDASKAPTLKPSNSVQATIAYQNYLYDLQKKAQEASPKIIPQTTSGYSRSTNSSSKSKTRYT